MSHYHCVTTTNVTLQPKCSCCIGAIWKAIGATLWDRVGYIGAFLCAQRPSATELLHKQGPTNEVSNDQDCWLPHYTGYVLWWTENLLGMCCIVCIPHYICSVFDVPRNLLVWYVLCCTYSTLYIFCILCIENLYLSGMCCMYSTVYTFYNMMYIEIVLVWYVLAYWIQDTWFVVRHICL